MTDTHLELQRAELTRALTFPAPGHGLPYWAFVDEDHARFEVPRTFGRDWVAVCPESAVAEGGRYFATSIGTEPVLVTRDADGRLHAMTNVCRHRGARLLDGCGRARRIQCPYHRWTYGLDGAFKGAPYDDDARKGDDRHLSRLPVEAWHGVVFVSLDPNVAPLQSRLRGIEEHIGEPATKSYVAMGRKKPVEIETWDANWKVIFENGIESYHLFAVHEETLEKASPTRSAYHIAGNDEWSVTGGSVKYAKDYRLVSLPPSFVGAFSGGTFFWLGVSPISAGQSRVVSGVSCEPHLLKYERLPIPGAGALARAFMDEDRTICERVQTGVQSARTASSALLEMERVVGDFHGYLRSRLLGAEAPGAGHARSGGD